MTAFGSPISRATNPCVILPASIQPRRDGARADRFGNYVQFQSSERPAPADATPIAPVAPDEPIEVSIYLRPRDAIPAPPAGAADARAALRADRERAYRDDIRLIADFAAANGLTVVLADAARRLVTLSGPASRMEQAFRTACTATRGRSGISAAAPVC